MFPRKQVVWDILYHFLEGFSFMVRDLPTASREKDRLQHFGCSHLANPHHSEFSISGHACPALNRYLILFLFLTITTIQNILQNTGRCRHSLSNSPGLGCLAGRRGHRASCILWALSEQGKKKKAFFTQVARKASD